jgi:hypothetical protein
MPDALVSFLNRRGYQPVLLPQTGLAPPDMYNVSGDALVRRGPLRDYLPELDGLAPIEASLPDFEQKFTTRKTIKLAVGFLEEALACIGISSIPRLDLSFAGSQDVRFAFSDIVKREVAPSALDQLIANIRLGAIPERYAREGDLHVAYEYVYAGKLLMTRHDQRHFDFGAKGDVAEFIKLGANAKVHVESETRIAFSRSGRDRVAFAYKSGRLLLNEGRWELLLRRDMLGGETEAQHPYIPHPGRLARVIESEATP